MGLGGCCHGKQLIVQAEENPDGGRIGPLAEVGLQNQLRAWGKPLVNRQDETMPGDCPELAVIVGQLVAASDREENPPN